jgi:hypothetical protein
MKNRYKIVSTAVLSGLAVICMMASSCKKLIQIPPSPKNELSATQIFADSVDALGAISAIYNNGLTPDINNGVITFVSGLSSDELTNTSGSDLDAQAIFYNAPTTDNGYVEQLWGGAYGAIYRINACIAGISASTGISASCKKQYLGELEVYRALYCFDMVNLFGAVPLPLTTDFKTNATLPRTSTTAVYTQIAADLTDATTKLTAKYPSSGHARPNVYTAWGYLAKVYLYLGQYQDATNAASMVINSGVYSLSTDLTKAFLDGSAEALWQLPLTTTLYGQTNAGYIFVPPANTIPTYTINAPLLNAFEAGDKRRTSWVGTTVVGGTTYYYPDKYKNRTTAPMPIEDVMMLRLADIYLVRAEASANLNQLTTAAADINLIRQRAGLNSSTASTQATILTAIYHERQTELFVEQADRWFDLKRTGMADAVLSVEKPGWVPSHALLPVPVAELQNDPKLTQNPGY